MLTFREFIHICEGKKAPPGAVKGTYQEKDGVKTYTLAPYEGPSGPLKSEKKVMKTLEKQGGIGGGAIKKAKKKVEKAERIKEDITQRRIELRQRQHQQMQAQKDKVSDYQTAQRQRRIEAKKREDLKAEIKKELQTEQHPVMVRPGEEPNPYNVAIAKQQASRKKTREVHAQQEMGASARSQQRSHNAVLRAIMSRRTVG